MFKGIGPTELVIIFLILVLLFGATRIGQIGGAIGRGIREFRHEVKSESEDEPASVASSAPAAKDEASPSTQHSSGSRTSHQQH